MTTEQIRNEMKQTMELDTIACNPAYSTVGCTVVKALCRVLSALKIYHTIHGESVNDCNVVSAKCSLQRLQAIRDAVEANYVQHFSEGRRSVN